MIDIEKEYPLTVAYPRGGHFFLLTWKDLWTQNNVIVAKTKKAALGVWEARCEGVTAMHGEELKVTGSWTADIVKPPHSLLAKFSLDRYLDDLNGFCAYTGRLIESVFARKRQPLPTHIRRCEKARPHYDHGCLYATGGGFMVKDYSVEALFDLCFERYNHGQERSRHIQSLAPEWDSSRPLYHVHSGGMNMGTVVDLVDMEDPRFGSSNPAAMFYFQGESLGTPTEATRVVDQIVHIEKVNTIKSHADYEARQAAAMRRSQLELAELLCDLV